MGNQGKNRQTSLPSRSRRTLPSTLGPFILEEESASPSLTPRRTAAMFALGVPVPAPTPAPAAAGHTGARPEKTERIKGFITRITGSQSHAQLPHSKTSQQPTYGPILPLTEDLLKRLMGAARKFISRTSSSRTLASTGKLTSFGGQLPRRSDISRPSLPSRRGTTSVKTTAISPSPLP
jgi:hypothetical protein